MAGGRKNFLAGKNKHKYMPDSHDIANPFEISFI
jgi:hypothetical protein